MKSPFRLVSIHPVGSAEYKREFDKLLPDDKTCGMCVHRNNCQTLFPLEQNTYCQFYPNQFKEGPAKKVKKKRKNGKSKKINTSKNVKRNKANTKAD